MKNKQFAESLSAPLFLPDEHYMLYQLCEKVFAAIGDSDLTIQWVRSLSDEDIRILFRLLKISGMPIPKTQHIN